MTPLTTIVADYHNPDHGEAIVRLLSNYALDEFGGAEPLSEFCQNNLVTKLAEYPQAFTVLAYDDERAVGLINCFQTLSTFACQPLINIHDVTVDKSARGKGVATLMLAKVEQIAIERGCCKLTLEVLTGNNIAQHAYEKFGFAGYELADDHGHALFWQKRLDE
jgi:ribosomal protein S18 acetylase RimI-like enzyme